MQTSKHWLSRSSELREAAMLLYVQKAETVCEPKSAVNIDVSSHIKELLLGDSRIPGIPYFWRCYCWKQSQTESLEKQTRYLEEHLRPLNEIYRPLYEAGNLQLKGLGEQLGQHKSFEDYCKDLMLEVVDCRESLDDLFYNLALDFIERSELSILFAVCQVALPQLWDDGYDYVGHSFFLMTLVFNRNGLYNCTLDILMAHWCITKEERTGLNYSGCAAGLRRAHFRDRLGSQVSRTLCLLTCIDAMPQDDRHDQVEAMLKELLQIPWDKHLSRPDLEDCIESARQLYRCPTVFLQAVLALARAVGETLDDEAIIILEASLRINPSSGSTPEFLRRMASEWRSECEDSVLIFECFDELAKNYHSSGNTLNGMLLLESFFAIEQNDYASAENLFWVTKYSCEFLPDETDRISLLSRLADWAAMTPERGNHHAARLLQAVLGIDDDCQTSLSDPFGETGPFDEISQVVLSECLQASVLAKWVGFALKDDDPVPNDLFQVDRNQTISRLIAVIQRTLGISEEAWDTHAELMREVMSSSLLQNCPEEHPMLIATLGQVMLRGTDRQVERAKHLMEAFFQIRNPDYDDLHSLNNAFWLDGGHAAGCAVRAECVRVLAESLLRIDAHGGVHAVSLLESFIGINSNVYENHDLYSIVDPEFRRFFLFDWIRHQVFQIVGGCEEDKPCLWYGERQRRRNEVVLPYVITLARAYCVHPDRGPAAAAHLLHSLYFMPLSLAEHEQDTDARRRLDLFNLKCSIDVRADLATVHCRALNALQGDSFWIEERGQGDPFPFLLIGELLDVQFIALSRAELHAKLKVAFGQVSDRALFARCLCVVASSLLKFHEKAVEKPTDVAFVETAINILEVYLQVHRSTVDLAVDSCMLFVDLESLVPDKNGQAEFVQILGIAAVLHPKRSPSYASELIEAGIRQICGSQRAAIGHLAGVQAANRVSLFGCWIRTLEEKPQRALHLCREIVNYVVTVQSKVLRGFQRRSQFVNVSAETWPYMQRVLLRQLQQFTDEKESLRTSMQHYGCKTNETEAERLAIELMQWAEQFHNRLLVERLFDEGLLGETTVLGSDGASPLEDWTPWQSSCEADGDSGEVAKLPEDDKSSYSLLYDVIEEDRVNDLERGATEVYPARSSLAAPLDRDELLGTGDFAFEELVPKGALYVRALFDGKSTKSRVRWWAWKHDKEGRLRLKNSWASDEGALGALQHAVDEFAERLKKDFDNQRIVRCFEKLTEVMNEQFNLSGLACEAKDVVFQVEGPLLSLPLAWLNSKEGPLWQVAESTSSVLSLTLRHVTEKLHTAPEPRALNAYWQPTGAERKTEREKEQALLAEMRKMRTRVFESLDKWEPWSLGVPEEQPSTTSANLQAALNNQDREFGVVVINAHGHRTEGVQLADGTWGGWEARWETVDLLVLACCSVGSLSQRSATEVEGSYAKLAVNRCRTVVAPRWPIHARVTTPFIPAILQEYAKAVEHANGRPVKPFAKARALAKARRKLVEEDLARAVTLSAFEIYGLA